MDFEAILALIGEYHRQRIFFNEELKNQKRLLSEAQREIAELRTPQSGDADR